MFLNHPEKIFTDAYTELLNEAVPPAEMVSDINTLANALIERERKRGKTPVMDIIKAKQVAQRMLQSDPKKTLADYLTDLKD